MSTRRIAAHYIYTPSGFLKDGVITVDGEGVITGIAEGSRLDSMCGVEFYSGIIIPGMVNAHTHLELSYMKGAVPAGCGFVGFARGMRENRSKCSIEQMHASAEYYDARMWSEGVQAVADVSNSVLTKDIKKTSRIEYHTFAEVYGLNTSSLEHVKELVREFRSEGLAVSVTPHSAYSLNEDVFGAAVKEDSAGEYPLSVHFMESEGEKLLFEGNGEMCEWYAECGFRTDFAGKYASPAQRVISHIPAARKVISVHNTYVCPQEIAALKKYFGDNIIWALCPRSNEYITGRLPDPDMFSVSGADITVGTDSLASNRDLSLMEELKMFKGVPLERMLRWVTVNGAKALGMEDRIGTLEEGKTPGIVLLEGVDMDVFELTAETKTRRLV